MNTCARFLARLLRECFSEPFVSFSMIKLKTFLLDIILKTPVVEPDLNFIVFNLIRWWVFFFSFS